ncbi:MAG: carbohydrate kinase family protein [Bacillota bacterium]
MSKFKVLVIGDIVIDRYLDSKNEYIGGSATNVALTISRNNPEFKVDLLGIIGRDKAGKQLFSRIRDTNVNPDKIIKLAGETAKATWKRTDSGTELVTVTKGVDQGISLDSLMSIDLKNYDLVHATPYSLGVNEIRFIRNKSKIFSFDASFILKKADIIELIPETNWLFVSGELASHHQWVKGLRSYPKEGLILLKGEKGVKFFDNTLKKYEISAALDGRIYDDLGAGDVFIGYLLSAYYNNFTEYNISYLLEEASEAASKACQYEGASNLGLV